MQTWSGGHFDLLAPRAEDVSIVDIAASLSRINRFAGHTVDGYDATGYSVAQHSVLVSLIVEQWGAPREVQREALLHDAGEAYYGDITAPVQRAIAEISRRDYKCTSPLADLKESVDAAVRIALGLPPDEHPLVKRADLVALACERVSLMAACERDWNLPEFADTRWTVIVPIEPRPARTQFMQRLEVLGGVR